MSYDKINDMRTDPSAYPYGQQPGGPPPTSYQLSEEGPPGPSGNLQHYAPPYSPPSGREQEDEDGEGEPGKDTQTAVSVAHLNVSTPAPSTLAENYVTCHARQIACFLKGVSLLNREICGSISSYVTCDCFILFLVGLQGVFSRA